MATFDPSISTVVVHLFRRSDDWPMFGSGVGTNGAGGPGILQTFGETTGDLSPLPSVTGVFGGLTPTDTPTATPSVPPAGPARPRRGARLPNWPRAAPAAPARPRAAPAPPPAPRTAARSPPRRRPRRSPAPPSRGRP